MWAQNAEECIANINYCPIYTVEVAYNGEEGTNSTQSYWIIDSLFWGQSWGKLHNFQTFLQHFLFYVLFHFHDFSEPYEQR